MAFRSKIFRTKAMRQRVVRRSVRPTSSAAVMEAVYQTGHNVMAGKTVVTARTKARIVCGSRPCPIGQLQITVVQLEMPRAVHALQTNFGATTATA